jgi:hypothetical protein
VFLVRKEVPVVVTENSSSSGFSDMEWDENGDEQQPLKQASEASCMKCEFIFFSTSLSLLFLCVLSGEKVRLVSCVDI